MKSERALCSVAKRGLSEQPSEDREGPPWDGFAYCS